MLQDRARVAIYGITPARHPAPRLSPSVAYGPDSSLMPLRRAPHRPDLQTWWAIDRP